LTARASTNKKKRIFLLALSLSSRADEKAIRRKGEGEAFIFLERSAAPIALFLNPTDRQAGRHASSLVVVYLDD
jgi:hypothetical protein